MSYKGKFRPIKPKKYKGDPRNIIYRSLWERKFMSYCDSNPAILSWASEEFYIPYFDPTTEKIRRYFPDFYIKYKNNRGKLVERVIEVKPLRQCKPPTQNKKTKRYIQETLEYAKNQAKWKAATDFCKDRKWEFQVMTEKELGV
tara:strand:+ start:411 stop:842 length:432 start_codon:yes stop_codon:yes gene_type:complete